MRIAGSGSLGALLDLHPVPPGLVLDPAVGDLYNNRDAHLARLLGDDAGLVHLGRARREATTIAWQLAVRTRLLRLIESLIGFADVLLQRVAEHRATIMPDYTYLQQAQPTTLAHYLLGFAFPVERDLQRAARALALVNRSPAGSGSVNGSRFGIDRARLAELLGFDGVVEHTRDAMWAPDLATETLSVVMTTLTNVDRFAEDLQVWATAEFGFVELDDADSRTSVVMPQKKNPYSLAHLRGEARHELGRWVGVLASNLTPTGQPDNRYYAYVDVPAALDHAAGSVDLFAGVLDRAVFSVERMHAAANSGYLYATDLCDFLAVATGADNRTLHRIVGLAVRRAIEAGGVPVTPDSVRRAASDLDEALGDFDDAEFERNRAPEHLVAAAPWHRWSGRRRHGRYARRPRRPPLPAPRRRRREPAPLVPRDLRRRDPHPSRGSRQVSLPVHLPARPAKPRTIGRTHAIDTGLGVGSIEDQLAVSGDLVDLAKLGWGTSLVTADLAAKIEAYRRHQVDVCFGGTLFELAYLQGRHLEYADWVADQGVTTIEISDGAVEFRGDDKLELIEKTGCTLHRPLRGGKQGRRCHRLPGAMGAGDPRRARGRRRLRHPGGQGERHRRALPPDR